MIYGDKKDKKATLLNLGGFLKKLGLFILSKITLLARLGKSSQLLEEINASLLTVSQEEAEIIKNDSNTLEKSPF